MGTFETCLQLRKLFGLEALASYHHETLELYSDLFVEPGNCRAIAALIEFNLKFATGVADAQAWAVRRIERAALGIAERASGGRGASRS